MYWFKCNKFIKFVNLETSYIFDKTLILSIVCSKCVENNDGTFKEDRSIEY